jgi:hypothetical protein
MIMSSLHYAKHVAGKCLSKLIHAYHKMEYRQYCSLIKENGKIIKTLQKTNRLSSNAVVKRGYKNLAEESIIEFCFFRSFVKFCGEMTESIFGSIR